MEFNTTYIGGIKLLDIRTDANIMGDKHGHTYRRHKKWGLYMDIRTDATKRGLYTWTYVPTPQKWAYMHGHTYRYHKNGPIHMDISTDTTKMGSKRRHTYRRHNGAYTWTYVPTPL